MSAQSLSSHDVSPHENVFAGSRLGRLLGPRIFETVLEWRRRLQSRRELAVLSEIDLRDIGYPARAEAEKVKPFWRA